MPRKPNPERLDNDAPEATEEWFAKARPAKDVLADLKRPGFRGGSNTGEWSHEEVPEVFA